MNKKVVALVLAVFVLSSQVFADIIVMRNGQNVVNATIVRISPDEIEYRVGEREIIHSARRADVDRIIYADGTSEVFSAPAVAQVAPTVVAQPAVVRERKSRDSEKNVQFGIRSSFNAFDIPDMKGVFFTIEFRGGEPIVTDYSTGLGITLGGIVRIPISNLIAFKPELDFTFRTPVRYRFGLADTAMRITTDARGTIREFAIGTQLLFEGTVTRDSRLFFESGIKMGIPFATNQSEGIKAGNQISGNSDHRNISNIRTGFDFGVVYGFGLHITDNISLGIRRTNFTNNFIRIESWRWNQLDLGINILFGS